MVMLTEIDRVQFQLSHRIRNIDLGRYLNVETFSAARLDTSTPSVSRILRIRRVMIVTGTVIPRPGRRNERRVGSSLLGGEVEERG